MSQSNVSPPTASHVENPRSEIQDPNKRKKRLSFGGTDGRGSPMFKSLETARAMHRPDGYDDQKPPDGFIGAAFKKFVSAKTGSTVGGGK